MPTAFASKLARTASGQWDSYHFDSEDDPKLGAQIKSYWLDLGLAFPGVSTAWSAVFVSWCVKKAGATPADFRFAPAHSVFVYNAINHPSGYRGLALNAAAPVVGDIIQNNRGGSAHDFAFARANPNYESHSAIVVETGTDSQGGYALTIGGNESDSVRRKIVRLDAGGKIRQRASNPYICLLQCAL